MKLVAFRDRDQDDAKRLYELHQALDRNRVRSVVTEFANLMDRPEIVEFMEALLG